MTSRLRAVSARTGGSRLTGANALVVAFGLAFLLLGLPAPAEAQWGKLEKLSGAGDWQGQIYEFRVACFGEKSRASDLTDEAESLTTRARALEKTGDPEERKRVLSAAATKWAEAADAWTRELGDTTPIGASEEEVRRAARRGRAMLTATSSAGVLWSLCKPDKQRRLSIDVGWSTWDADPDPNYAGGARINLDMLMPLVSWRVLADTKYDLVELSAGAGVYWFSSTGFKSLNGVVLQPARLTFRAPSSWSGKPLNDPRRWAAIPVYGFGLTLFPAGFEPNDFAGVGDKAVRIPRELLGTHYIFVNVEPFLRMFGK